MRHGIQLRKFGRKPSHRRSMFRNLATSLLEHGRIETTVPKAKDLRRVTEKLITLAGEDTLHRRREAHKYLNTKSAVHKLFSEIGPHFKERPGGYTRVLKTRRRAGDNAELAIIELVKEEYKGGSKKASPKKEEAQEKVADGATEVEEAASDVEKQSE